MGNKKGKKGRTDLDANIIEYLMLEDDSQSARQIAEGIGKKSELKYVTNRLNTLKNKNIVTKLVSPQNKKVLWSIENDTSPINENYESTNIVHNENVSFSVVDIENNESEITDHNDDNATDKAVIENLKAEILYLRAMLKEFVSLIQVVQNVSHKNEPFIEVGPKRGQTQPSVVKQPIDQPINQSTNQPINQSINQLINQLINQ